MVCFDIYEYFIRLFVILSGYNGYDYILSCSVPTIYLIEKPLKPPLAARREKPKGNHHQGGKSLPCNFPGCTQLARTVRPACSLEPRGRPAQLCATALLVVASVITTSINISHRIEN